MGDFRDREGFLSGSEGGKMGLRSPSGGTSGCIREYFLGPGETFLRAAGYFVAMCMNIYQPIPTFISFYQLLCQSLSISMTLNQSLSIFSCPRVFLVRGCFLGSAAVGRRPLESADPSGCPACGGRNRETSLASTPLEGLTGSCGQSTQCGYPLGFFGRSSLL